MKGKLDKFLGYFVSKKLSVFIVASFFIGFGMIESTEWVNVSLIYIGGQSVIDAVAKLRK
jgi:membrane-associated protease RseP (regulator of RpoE activity)